MIDFELIQLIPKGALLWSRDLRTRDGEAVCVRVNGKAQRRLFPGWKAVQYRLPLRCINKGLGCWCTAVCVSEDQQDMESGYSMLAPRELVGGGRDDEGPWGDTIQALEAPAQWLPYDPVQWRRDLRLGQDVPHEVMLDAVTDGIIDHAVYY